MKTTKDVVLDYYSAFDKKSGWDKMITDDVIFSSPTGDIKGKDAFIELTNQFIQGVTSASVKSVITEGDSASAVTNYKMALPTGDKLDLDVSEIVEVKGQRIKSFKIYFDTAKMNEFMAKMQKAN